MLDLLTEPYPLRKSTAYENAFHLGTGAFVAFFLIVFQPFGTQEFKSDYKYLFLAGYGVVISATIWCLSRLLPRLFPRSFEEENWTVGKHILFQTLVFGLAIAACYLYKNFSLGCPNSWHGFWGFFPLALSVAVFPITGLVVVDYILQLQRFTRGAEAANQVFLKKQALAPPAAAVLYDENGKPAIELLPSQLLFVQAADNYVEVHYLDKQAKASRLLIRRSLSSLEASLAPMGLYRCHRSYLVNLAAVARVGGNAQGYRLYFPGFDASVPVARGRNAEILAKLA